MKRAILVIVCLLSTSALFCSERCCGSSACSSWSAQIDYLYWKTDRSGLQIGLDNNPPNLESFAFDPEWSSGVRAGVFYECSRLGFDIGVRYLHYSNSTSETRSPTGLNLLQERLLRFLALQSIDASYEMTLDVVDIELSCCIEPRCFNGYVRPFCGARLAYLDEEVRLVGGIVFGFPPTATDYFFKQQVDQSGYGFYLGCEGAWNVWRCLGMFAEAQLGWLQACADFKSFEGIDPPSQLFIPFGTFILDEVNPIYTTALRAGVQSDWCVGGCFALNLQLGYEFQKWSLSDFAAYGQGVASPHPVANLILHGLVVRAGLSY